MVINPIVGVYIPIIRIPIKGGMTIPNIATFDHGTFDYNTSHGKTYVALELPHEEHASHFFNNSREENTQKTAQARFHRQNGQVCYCKIHGYQQTAFGEDQGA